MKYGTPGIGEVIMNTGDDGVVCVLGANYSDHGVSLYGSVDGNSWTRLQRVVGAGTNN